MKKPKYTVKLTKQDHCWSVYDPNGDWIADVINEPVAKKIADALNYCEFWNELECKKNLP